MCTDKKKFCNILIIFSKCDLQKILLIDKLINNIISYVMIALVLQQQKVWIQEWSCFSMCTVKHTYNKHPYDKLMLIVK